jgi:lipid II:glycine glycyltransferase (peptidoglycan interpeptide bridge formation enzyme)
MIRFVKKFTGIGVSEVWFAEKITPVDRFKLSGYMHMQQAKTGIGVIAQHSCTVENSLLPDAESIFAGYSKTVQVEVKQAQKKNIACRLTSNLAQFVDFYNDFAADRNIDLTSERRLKEMEPYLQISMAFENDILLAAHSYLADKDAGIVRLMQSASARLNPAVDKQLTGRANKLLHYFDMLHFKKEGYHTYDFGGYAMDTADKGLQGINKFKLSFGGEIKTCKNYCSYPYYILKKLAAATGRLGRA